MSPTILRKTILLELSGAYEAGVPLAQPTLLVCVQQRLPRTSLADLVEALSWLRDRELVTYVADSFEPDNRDARHWSITTAGRASLKS